MDIRLPVSQARFLIVHYHIFKNGGSTIASILEREFPNGFATVHGPDDVSVLDQASLADFIAEHAAIQAISSHHLRYPKPIVPNTIIFDCCFLDIRWIACNRCIRIFSASIPMILCAAWPARNHHELF